MLALEMRRKYPGYRRQIPGRSIQGELLRRYIPGAALKLGNIGYGKPPVIAPGELRSLKVGRQRGQVEGGGRAGTRIVDYRRGGRDQHQMIRSRIARYIAEEVIAQRELLGVGPVGCDVGLLVLLAYGFGGARE